MLVPGLKIHFPPCFRVVSREKVAIEDHFKPPRSGGAVEDVYITEPCFASKALKLF